MDPKVQRAIAEREEMVRRANQTATPVPQTFDQAVTWAVSASIAAAEAGNPRQTMCFNCGAGEADMSGEIADVLSFAEGFVMTLSRASSLQGGKVRVVFSDMGAASLAQSRWSISGDDERIEVNYLPPIMRLTTPSAMEQAQLDEIADAAYIVIVAPKQNEVTAFLELIKTIDGSGRDVPIVVLNQKFVQDPLVLAGLTLKTYRGIEQKMTHTFHLEQVDPTRDNPSLNPCVIAKVYPRPYSFWEDCPEDVDAVDGYFLLDIQTAEKTPRMEDVLDLLAFSRDARNKLVSGNK